MSMSYTCIYLSLTYCVHLSSEILYLMTTVIVIVCREQSRCMPCMPACVCISFTCGVNTHVQLSGQEHILYLLGL